MQADAVGVFSYFYQATNLIRLVQYGRADADNVRRLVQEATAMGKLTFPHLAEGLDTAAAEFNRAIDHGLVLKSNMP